MTSYNKRILGDATGEMRPFWSSSGYYQSTWYADYSSFVEPTLPWFARGGDRGSTTKAGQFDFYRNAGGAYAVISARLVLKP